MGAPSLRKQVTSFLKSVQAHSNVKKLIVPLALMLPLFVMMGYHPTFLEIKAHAFDMFNVARNIASGYLYTHACIFMGDWSRIWYGPISEYLLAPFVRVFPSLLTLYAVGVMLAIFAGLLLYKLCHEFFGPRTAYVSVWIYATMAYVPNQLRRLIIQEYLFFFCILAIYSVFKMKFKKQMKYFSLLCVAIAFILQIHISAIPVLVLLFFVPWKGLWKQRRHLFAGAVVLLLLFLPNLTYLYEDRVWIWQRTNDNLAGIREGGEKSFIGSKTDYSLSQLRRDLFMPMDDILKHEDDYDPPQNSPLQIRAGLLIYEVLYLAGVFFGALGILLALAWRAVRKKSSFDIDKRHLILLVLWLVSLGWISLFPYHTSHHLILLFFPSTIFVGLVITALVSFIPSRTVSRLVWGMLLCLGLVSTLAFLISVNANVKQGSNPTLSGLSYQQEKALSYSINEKYPHIGGERILFPGRSETYLFNTHQFLYGPQALVGTSPDRVWREMFGCGPRARFPKFFRSLGIFLDEEAVEQQQSSQSNSIVTYLLLYSGSPSAPLDAETQYLPDLNVSIIEVGQLNAGEAAISLCSDEGKDDSSSLEQYPLSLPLAQVNSDNFPPLSSGSPCMRYQYLFNATGARRTLFFVSALEVGDYQENYYLDGKPVNATRVFRRGGAFLLDISPGEHLFEVSLQPNEDQFVYPFQSFELYLFDLAS